MRVEPEWSRRISLALLWAASLACSGQDVTWLSSQASEGGSDVDGVGGIDQAGTSSTPPDDGTLGDQHDNEDVARRYFDAAARSRMELDVLASSSANSGVREVPSAPCSGCLFSELCMEGLAECTTTYGCVERNCLCPSCLTAASDQLPGGGPAMCVALCAPVDERDCAGAWREYMACKVSRCASACNLPSVRDP